MLRAFSRAIPQLSPRTQLSFIFKFLLVPCGCRANMAHIRNSRPDSGLGSEVKVLKASEVLPSLLGSGVPSTHQLSEGGANPLFRSP